MTGRSRLRVRGRLLAFVLLASAFVGANGLAGESAALGAPTAAVDRAAGKKAASWLAGRPTAAMSPGLQSDVIVALEHAGARPRALRPRANRLARLGPGYATTAGAAAKVALAADAAGLDPGRLRGVDYLRRITTRYRGGRYGRSSFDQALSMLALDAAGRPIPRATRTFLASRRGSGGWGFDLRRGGKDEVDSTALIVVALRAAGVPERAPVIRGAMAWLARQRNSAGGYAVAGGGRRTGANATALVIQAEIAVGRRPNRKTLAALRRLQAGDGSIRFTSAQAGDRGIATAGAIPALMGRPY